MGSSIITDADIEAAKLLGIEVPAPWTSKRETTVLTHTTYVGDDRHVLNRPHEAPLETWEVAGSTGRTYFVEHRPDTRNGGTYWHCNCQGWLGAWNNGHYCKHIEGLGAYRRRNER